MASWHDINEFYPNIDITHHTPLEGLSGYVQFPRQMTFTQLFCDISGTQNRKDQNFLTSPFSVIPILRFSLIKLHVKKGPSSLNEVCEGVAGLKNHTNKCCRPWAYFASKMSLLF